MSGFSEEYLAKNFDQWREWSRTDDHFEHFVLSDIRVMLGEIIRLKACLAASAEQPVIDAGEVSLAVLGVPGTVEMVIVRKAHYKALIEAFALALSAPTEGKADGWQTVPVEPTPAMFEAFEHVHDVERERLRRSGEPVTHASWLNTNILAYAAMLAAATPKAGG